MAHPVFGKEVAIYPARARPSFTGRYDGRSLLRRTAANIAAFVFNVEAEATLSERVRRRIEQQQAGSEILVGSIRAGAIVFFPMVYAISPKAFPP